MSFPKNSLLRKKRKLLNPDLHTFCPTCSVYIGKVNDGVVDNNMKCKKYELKN